MAIAVSRGSEVPFQVAGEGVETMHPAGAKWGHVHQGQVAFLPGHGPCCREEGRERGMRREVL